MRARKVAMKLLTMKSPWGLTAKSTTSPHLLASLPLQNNSQNSRGNGTKNGYRSPSLSSSDSLQLYLLWGLILCPLLAITGLRIRMEYLEISLLRAPCREAVGMIFVVLSPSIWISSCSG